MDTLDTKLADIEAIIENCKPSKRAIYSGYRPAFRVKTDYLTSGEIRFHEKKEIKFGEKAVVEIKFITPEFYPNSLKVGQVIAYQEGSKIHGYATITKIYNKILECD